VATVSADQLAGTSGQDTASALYSDLSGNIGALGADVTLDGSDLLFDFNAADTLNIAGIEFGTTSPSSGLSAEVGNAVPGPATLLVFVSSLASLVSKRRRR
jgi:hypothetical protein